MAFIPVPNVVQARLIFQEDNGVVAQNVFWHATSSAPTMTDLEDIGGTWGDLFTEFLIQAMTTNWQCNGIALRAMNEAEGINLFFDDGFPKSGTSSGAPQADQVAYTVTWNTGLVGRSARGRTYGVGLPAEWVVNRNQINPANFSDLSNRWNGVREAFETEGHALQVVSFQEGGVPRTEGRNLPVLSGQLRFPLATQRRRLS